MWLRRCCFWGGPFFVCLLVGTCFVVSLFVCGCCCFLFCQCVGWCLFTFVVPSRVDVLFIVCLFVGCSLRVFCFSNPEPYFKKGKHNTKRHNNNNNKTWTTTIRTNTTKHVMTGLFLFCSLCFWGWACFCCLYVFVCLCRICLGGPCFVCLLVGTCLVLSLLLRQMLFFCFAWLLVGVVVYFCCAFACWCFFVCWLMFVYCFFYFPTPQTYL